MERLSLLAAIVLVDEQRWDGQERSTRYQNFQVGWYLPDSAVIGAAELYAETIENLFAAISDDVRTFMRRCASADAAARGDEAGSL